MASVNAGKVDRACQFFEEMVGKKLIPKYETYILLLDELKRLHKNGEKRRIQENDESQDREAIDKAQGILLKPWLL